MVILFFTGYIEQRVNDENIWIVRADSNLNTTSIPLKIIERNSSMSDEFKLFQNYPNPFNGRTKINFNLNKSAFLRLEIFDNRGKLIQILFNNYLNKGYHELVWDSKNLSSGLYFINIKTGNKSITIKSVILK